MLQPFSLDYFQTTFTLFDILVEMYHKFKWFLTSDRDIGNNSTAKEFDMSAEVGQSTNVTISTMDTMNKIDVKVKVSFSCLVILQDYFLLNFHHSF